MSKFETLISGVHKLAHVGELDEKGLITIAPQLGIERGFHFYGIFDGDVEGDQAYFNRVHETLRDPNGIAQLEEHYETLTSKDRQDIGREINRVRIKRS